VKVFINGLTMKFVIFYKKNFKKMESKQSPMSSR
jgi:hypothetical protein